MKHYICSIRTGSVGYSLVHQKYFLFFYNKNISIIPSTDINTSTDIMHTHADIYTGCAKRSSHCLKSIKNKQIIPNIAFSKNEVRWKSDIFFITKKVKD